MTRIIAGSLGGRRIAVAAKGTRPTTDRVREAMFGKLDAAGVLQGARVLDAFAGSGALGIEALSRGASDAVFVESASSAARVIAANLKDLGLDDRAALMRLEVLAFLRFDGDSFDVAFLDPPYDLPPQTLTAVLAALVAHLAPGATVVLECSSRGAAPAWPDGMVPSDVRKYGETSVHFARVAGDKVEP